MKPIPFLFCSLLTFFAARAEPLPQSGGATEPPLSLDAVTRAVLSRNPALAESRAKWEGMKQRVPQAAAWEDLKVSGSTKLGRFVEVARNSFTDETLSVEQMIPLSGRNRSRARIAAAEALGSLEELRRRELDLVGKARAAWFRLTRDYALLELNRSDEASLTQSLEIGRARLEAGRQSQAEVLMAEGERERIQEARRDLERAISEDGTQLAVLMNRDPFAAIGHAGGAE